MIIPAAARRKGRGAIVGKELNCGSREVRTLYIWARQCQRRSGMAK